MLPTPTADRRNRLTALGTAAVVAVPTIVLAVTVHPAWWIGPPIAVAVYAWIRRTIRRRRRVVAREMPDHRRGILAERVAFYAALSEDERRRFEGMVQVFLDEVAVTGIDTDVDEVTRMLVAASAVIPVFGFTDWEYGSLGEVLIYPGSFNDRFEADAAQKDRNILGMVGDYHLSGTMVLSEPSLIAGFRNATDKRNVGIHEFAHLIDKRSGDIDGVPPTAPDAAIDPWVRWVGNELKRDGSFRDIDDYAYTNEAEYFAVLTEYFFENPAQLQSRHPKLYDLMRRMYHQDTRRRFSGRRRKRRRRTRRNDPCPCGSGEKYKRCCRLRRRV